MKRGRLEEARLLAEQSAAQGFPGAQQLMGAFYYTGELGGENRDQQAKYWLKRAADPLGGNWKGSQMILAMGYIKGRFSNKRPFKRALYWLELAHRGGMEGAACLIGRLYYDGDLGEENRYQNAEEWLLRAANGEEPDTTGEAEYFLGNIYNDGLLGERDASKAKRYYQRAAEKKYASAFNRLGLGAYKGTLGAEKNLDDALKWFQEAWTAGCSTGAVNCALVHWLQGRRQRSEEILSEISDNADYRQSFLCGYKTFVASEDEKERAFGLWMSGFLRGEGSDGDGDGSDGE